MSDDFLAVDASRWVGRILVLANSVAELSVAGTGEAEGSLGAGSLAAPPAHPFPGTGSDVIGVSCLYIRTHVIALLKHATDVASTEKSLLFMCVLVLVLLIVCWKNMKCICLVNIVCSPLKLWTKQELRHHAAGALFKSVWKPHANI